MRAHTNMMYMCSICMCCCCCFIMSSSCFMRYNTYSEKIFGETVISSQTPPPPTRETSYRIKMMMRFRLIGAGIVMAVVTSYVVYQVYSGSKKKKKKRRERKKGDDDVFARACDRVKELDGLDTKVQLELYGLFKQATKGKCTAPQPWASDFRGRAKWDAWKKNKDMTKEDAAKAYVSLVDRLVPDSLEQDTTSTIKKKKNTSQGMGLSVSTMMKEEIEDDREDDVFVFCSKGETDKVLNLVHTGKVDVNQKDEEMGMTLLHWACDRGHLSLVKSLLSLGANIDSKDGEGTTPLGMAVLCEHQEVALFLIRNGANPDIKDESGESPRDSFNDELRRASAKQASE